MFRMLLYTFSCHMKDKDANHLHVLMMSSLSHTFGIGEVCLILRLPITSLSNPQIFSDAWKEFSSVSLLSLLSFSRLTLFSYTPEVLIGREKLVLGKPSWPILLKDSSHLCSLFSLRISAPFFADTSTCCYRNFSSGLVFHFEVLPL